MSVEMDPRLQLINTFVVSLSSPKVACQSNTGLSYNCNKLLD